MTSLIVFSSLSWWEFVMQVNTLFSSANWLKFDWTPFLDMLIFLINENVFYENHLFRLPF